MVGGWIGEGIEWAVLVCVECPNIGDAWLGSGTSDSWTALSG